MQRSGFSKRAIRNRFPLEALKGGSRRGRLPEIRARLARELVEGFGLTMAETSRQLGVTTSGISKYLEGNKLDSSLSR